MIGNIGKCLCCGRRMREQRNIANGEVITPEPGNFTICAFCATISKVNKEGNLVELTPKEMFGIFASAPDEYFALLKLQELIKEMLKAQLQ